MADYATLSVLWYFLLQLAGGSIVPKRARQTESTEKGRVAYTGHKTLVEMLRDKASTG